MTDGLLLVKQAGSQKNTQVQRHLEETDTVFLIEVISEVHAFFSGEAQEREKLERYKGLRKVVIQHGRKMMKAKAYLIVANITFGQLIGGSEFKEGTEAQIIVIHDDCSAQNHRNQEGQCAFQETFPGGALPIKEKLKKEGSRKGHGQQNRIRSGQHQQWFLWDCKETICNLFFVIRKIICYNNQAV